MSYTVTPEDGGGGGGGFPGYGSVSSVGTANNDGVAATVARSDHIHAHDNQPGGTLHALAVASGAAGFLSGADKAKLDGIAPGATNTPLSAVAAQTVGAANTVGVGTSAARDDHVHAHGAQTDPTMHAAVTGLANGFMTPAMLATLTALVAMTPFVVDIPVDFGAVNLNEGNVSATAAHASITGSTVFQRPIVLANALDHDPEDVLIEELDANIQSSAPGTVTINCFAPNSTWGRYTVRLIAYNP